MRHLVFMTAATLIAAKALAEPSHTAKVVEPPTVEEVRARLDAAAAADDPIAAIKEVCDALPDGFWMECSSRKAKAEDDRAQGMVDAVAGELDIASYEVGILDEAVPLAEFLMEVARDAKSLTVTESGWFSTTVTLAFEPREDGIPITVSFEPNDVGGRQRLEAVSVETPDGSWDLDHTGWLKVVGCMTSRGCKSIE